MKQRIVLAYSGGLDAETVVPWLASHYNADIVTVTVDLGQEWPLDHLRVSALASGALRAHVVDARTEFARDFVLPALQAGAVYDGGRLRATPLGQPLIARKLVEIARIEQAHTIACEGSELESAIHALDPQIRVVAARPESAVPERAVAHHRATPITRVHNLPAHVAISFEQGVPTSINGVTMDPIELLESVATIAAGQGVGVDAGDDAPVRTDRTICEAPAAIVLQTAHQALDASITHAQKRLSGVVRLVLSEGACTVEGVEAQTAPFHMAVESL